MLKIDLLQKLAFGLVDVGDPVGISFREINVDGMNLFQVLGLVGPDDQLTYLWHLNAYLFVLFLLLNFRAVDVAFLVEEKSCGLGVLDGVIILHNQ